MLEVLGISATGESVYRTLLAQPDWSAADIAAYLRMSERSVRAAFDELESLELLRESVDRPGRVLPISPEIAFSGLLATSEADVMRQYQQIGAARAAIAAISVEYRNAAGERDSVIRHDGIDAVRIRIESLADSVQREVVSLNPIPAQTFDAQDAGPPLNQRILERGVAIRCVYQDGVRNHSALVRYAQRLTDLGGQIRVAPLLPMLIIVYDGEIALVPIDPANTRAGALELHTPGLVATIQSLFEQTWLFASPLGPRTADFSGLDALELSILRLLGEGFTDEVVARRVGLSLRTLRRTTSDLMERLDARSRFQAGKEAAMRGWI